MPAHHLEGGLGTGAAAAHQSVKCQSSLKKFGAQYGLHALTRPVLSRRAPRIFKATLPNAPPLLGPILFT